MGILGMGRSRVNESDSLPSGAVHILYDEELFVLLLVCVTLGQFGLAPMSRWIVHPSG